MKEACKQRVKEADEIIKRSDKGDKSACLPTEGARKMVGCYATSLRDKKGMELGESMKEAWKVYNKYKC